MADLGSTLSRDFRKSFLDVGASNAHVLRSAREAATRSFFLSDLESCSGAAFCFVVQQLASTGLGLTTYHQLQMAILLKKQLALRK